MKDRHQARREQDRTGPSFETPAALRLDRHYRDSWEQLGEDVHGAVVAPTRTLLAAVAGGALRARWRVGATASALRFAAGLAPCPSVSNNLAGGKLPRTGDVVKATPIPRAAFRSSAESSPL